MFLLHRLKAIAAKLRRVRPPSGDDELTTEVVPASVFFNRAESWRSAGPMIYVDQRFFIIEARDGPDAHTRDYYTYYADRTVVKIRTTREEMFTAIRMICGPELPPLLEHIASIQRLGAAYATRRRTELREACLAKPFSFDEYVVVVTIGVRGHMLVPLSFLL